ncbi:MAG: pyruvate kinase, partial [Clostridia bacterium]|nr:pyruvate kinase [Clostridia bacterium]
MRKTKIICTIGPVSEKEPMMRKLVENGMNVARLNFSHANHAEHKARIVLLKKLRIEYKTPIAILLDTKGPEVRVKSFEGEAVTLKQGGAFKLCTNDCVGDETKVAVTYDRLNKDVTKGTRILLDDGLIELAVEKVEKDGVVCRIINGGVLKENKSVNVPDIDLKMKYVSEKDENDILFGIGNDIDYVAASFCRSSEDVLAIRKILESNGGKSVQIIAKIENGSGVENIDEILKVSDGIMVARGDMGVEMDIVDLPRIQKMLIKKAYSAGKKVITATQMLDSMISNPRPTRAEATDVANAVYDGTSAIMLSGETAMGDYPLESLTTMSRIAMKTEENIRYENRFTNRLPDFSTSITSAISQATCSTAHSLGASAIIAFTQSGRTARMVSSFRPSVPIIACSPKEKTCNQLAMSWGVWPIKSEEYKSTDKMFTHAVQLAQSTGLVKQGDVVVITAGAPIGVSGSTNMLEVQIVGNVLIKGTGIASSSVHGKLCVCENETQLRERFEKGDRS